MMLSEEEIDKRMQTIVRGIIDPSNKTKDRLVEVATIELICHGLKCLTSIANSLTVLSQKPVV